MRSSTALRSLCGKAFAGRIVANLPPPSGEDAFSGKALVMHVRACGRTIAIPFHVGDDRSRTWVITPHRPLVSPEARPPARGRQPRHARRSYGGDAVAPGTAGRQEFPVDAFPKRSSFGRGMDASIANIWAMEMEPGRVRLRALAAGAPVSRGLRPSRRWPRRPRPGASSRKSGRARRISDVRGARVGLRNARPTYGNLESGHGPEGGRCA